MRQNKIFEKILGYRSTAYLGYVMSQPLEKRKALLTSQWPAEAKDLLKLSHYIKYQFSNYSAWKELHNMEQDGPLLDAHQPELMIDYILGLVERNEFIWKDHNLRHVFDFIEDRSVIDYGYGGGWYSRQFCKIAKKVFGIERKEVADYVLNCKPSMPDNFKDISVTQLYKLQVGVIWISEVFHGDGGLQILNTIDMLSTALKPGGILVVNELKKNTILGDLFNCQMKLHTKSGRLYSREELLEIIPFKRLTVDADYPYHFMIGGELNV